MTLKLAPGLELPDDAVTQTFGILAKRGAGKSNAAAVMAEEMYKAHLPFVVVDPVGAWWGLRADANGKRGGLQIPIFGGNRGDVPLEPTSGQLMADLIVGKNLSAVLDVSDFDSETQKRRFLADFAERLYTAKGKPGQDTPLHVFLEEADDYIPQKGTREAARTLGAFERIVKRGRGRGLGATMITQRSASLNKDVLTQIETLIVLRIVSPTDRKPIADWVTYHGQAKEILASLQELAPGEAWVWSMWLDLTERVQIRRRRTFDSGATPSVKSKRAVATLADVDLPELGEQIAATIERAKAEDPKALHRRILELERQLTSESRKHSDTAEPVIQRVEVPVEVPVLSEDDRVLLKGLAESLERVGDLGTLLGSRLIGLVQQVDEARGRSVDQRVERALPARATPAVAASPSRKAPRPRSVLSAASQPGEPVRSAPVSSQQRILDALAWLRAIGVDVADKVQLAFLSDTRPTSGGYKNNLGALRSAGLIDYPAGGTVALTDAGAAIAEPGDTPTTTADLHDAIYAKLGRARAAILEQLIGTFPRAVNREDLANAVGVPVTSGGFKNNLGSLRSLGLIDYPAPGSVVALDVLFLEGVA